MSAAVLTARSGSVAKPARKISRLRAASQFSDSVILSRRNDDDGLIYTVHFVSLLASELFLNGVWCRGAIASGKMHHNGDVAFGPALIDAIEMERQLAVYPRILVTDTVADKFVEINNADLPKWRRVDQGVFFRRDFDHMLHLDIFSYRMFVPEKTGTIKDAVKVVHQHVLKGIDATQTLSNMKIQTKLFWIGAYLDHVDEAHGAFHFTISKNRAALSSKENTTPKN
jgi:hypothetical protein